MNEIERLIAEHDDSERMLRATGGPVNLMGLPHARFFCKGHDPERRFYSEYELVKHILEVRGAPRGTVTYAEDGGEGGDESRS